jgi:hypothetical protein
MTHAELVAALEALQAQVAALLAKLKESGPQPLSGGGPGEE